MYWRLLQKCKTYYHFSPINQKINETTISENIVAWYLVQWLGIYGIVSMARFLKV